MQNKEVNLRVFGKTAKNLESINVSKSHWQNSHVYKDCKISHCIMGVKQNSNQNFLGRLQTELPPTSDLLLKASAKPGLIHRCIYTAFCNTIFICIDDSC